MSRELHVLEITDEHLRARHKARVIAATVVIAFFTAFVAFAPEGDGKSGSSPAVTAAASGKTEAKAGEERR